VQQRLFPGSAGTLKALALTRALEIDPGENHRQLRRAQFDAAGVRRAGYLEAAGFKSLVPDDQPVGVPVKDFDAITSPVEEEEKGVTRRPLCCISVV
jgi:hypothetical protein